MYKVIIQTTETLPPIKSPIFNIQNLRNPQQPVSPLLTTTIPNSENPTPTIHDITGSIYLLRNLSLCPQQPSSRVKSPALLLLNPDIPLQSLLQERSPQLQHLCTVHEPIIIPPSTKLGVNEHLVVVFKSIAMAEEVYWFVEEKGARDLMVFYVEGVSVLTVDEIGQGGLKEKGIKEDGWVEIPHCSRCLEILQSEVTGLRQKYPLKPPKQQMSPSPVPAPPICKVCLTRSQKHPQCSTCSQVDDNWVCMVCGVIGCGRYKNADAYKHYTASQHILSLDLDSNRIWNYKLDCFVHRVVGRDDGVGVMGMGEGQGNGDYDDEQVEAEFWKYCNVVSEQLDRQRNFYNRIKDEEIERYTQEEKQLADRLQGINKIKQEKKENLKKKIKRNKKLAKRYTELQEECKEERALNKMYEDSATNKEKYRENEKNSDIIMRKRQELKKLQQQIQKMLINLSES